jgi:chaperonin cofactor prefoldin
MGLPEEPVTFTAQEVEALNQKLSDLRHNVNNHLSLIVAALELLRRKPETAPRVLNTLNDQPEKIVEELQQFSREFERAFGINQQQR